MVRSLHQLRLHILSAAVLLVFTAPALSATEETGYASWYGGKFQGRRTANGEIFDTNELTAAHKTLPFGSIVKVKNLRNGETVRVRINDRGPFVEGRIIDLSRAAAREIDMLGSGVTPVSLTVVRRPDGSTPESPAAALPHADQLPLPALKSDGPKDGAPGGKVKAVSPASYTLQIASFSVRENAEELRKRLAHNGFSPSFEKSASEHIRVVLTGIEPQQLDRVTGKLSELGYSQVLVREEYN